MTSRLATMSFDLPLHDGLFFLLIADVLFVLSLLLPLLGNRAIHDILDFLSQLTANRACTDSACQLAAFFLA